MAAKTMTFTITEQGSSDRHVFLNIFLDSSPWEIDGVNQNPIVLDREAILNEKDSILCTARREIREYLIENQAQNFSEQKTGIENLSVSVRS